MILVWSCQSQTSLSRCTSKRRWNYSGFKKKKKLYKCESVILNEWFIHAYKKKRIVMSSKREYLHLLRHCYSTVGIYPEIFTVSSLHLCVTFTSISWCSESKCPQSFRGFSFAHAESTATHFTSLFAAFFWKEDRSQMNLSACQALNKHSH